jgi:two-component system chemotaxis response regulator CheB
MPRRDIIVIAGSAGAVQELRTLVAQLPEDFSGSLFIVIHTSAGGPGLLAHILDRSGPLPVIKPRDGDAIRPAHVYVAPPDHHLLVRSGHIELGNGPRENGFRPAADPLFRSAANVYGPRVVGIVLSGVLDDGTLGLQAVKSHGGVAIVQHPEEALYPGMPENALRNVAVDHVLRVCEIPALLLKLAGQPGHNGKAIMKRHNLPRQKARNEELSSLAAGLKGPPSGFICPECGGSLWELENGKIVHYRCHVGHAYTAESLVASQDGEVEAALWTALRTLEETAALRRRLANNARNRNMHHVARGYEERAHQIEQRAGVIRKVLLSDDLPARLKGFGSSKATKFLSHQRAKPGQRRRRTKK